MFPRPATLLLPWDKGGSEYVLGVQIFEHYDAGKLTPE
jgi:hypothetical protein